MNKNEEENENNFGWFDKRKWTTMIPRLVSKGHQQYISWSKADKNSFKYKLYSMGNKMMVRINVSETFLKSISVNTNLIEIQFNSKKYE